MQEHIWIKPISHMDLSIYQYGKEDCLPGHSFGPAVRDHYLLHFITHGRGVFSHADQIYHVSQNQGFVICPDNITYYEADGFDPWRYQWIGVGGANAGKLLSHCGIHANAPIFSFPDAAHVREIFSEMKTVDEKTHGGQLALTGLFYLLLSQIRGQGSDAQAVSGHAYGAKKEYVQSAIVYIQKNYGRRLSVEEISDYIGLNRSYFGAIFKENTKMSPQEFIIRFRMQKAEKLLENRGLTIGDVARSVGYEDPLLFSKIFKKTWGMSPSEYRKTLAVG